MKERRVLEIRDESEDFAAIDTGLEYYLHLSPACHESRPGPLLKPGIRSDISRRTRSLSPLRAASIRLSILSVKPSLRGGGDDATIIFSPSAGGGPNWGGGAYDPDSHIMVVPSNRVPMVITLIPAEKTGEAVESSVNESLLSMTFPVAGSDYHYRVEPLFSPLGAPCSEPPWAALTAVDLARREIVWEIPLGDAGKMMSLPFSLELGTPGAGGPLVTAGGLVFIGYTLDDTFRAIDLGSGEILWEADLPAAGTAIPVTYEAGGDQYVVIPAGGHSMYQSTLGDSVVAYKLKAGADPAR